MERELQTINHGGQLSVEDMQSHVAVIEQMAKAVMKPNMHYGKIPGCGDKPTLWQPGAQKLALAFQLSAEPEVEREDLPGGHREYHVRCRLISRASGQSVGTGLGNCSTMESRYRYRTQVTNDPVPKEYWQTRDSNILGGPQYSPRKVDGKWVIAEKIEHDNPADYYNTCEKMAKKRAFVDAILTCTAASDHFTQDIEDNPELYGGTTPPADTSTDTAPAGNGETIPFGKYKGKPWSEADNGWLHWCEKNAQSDKMKAKAREEIDRRKQPEGEDQDSPAMVTEKQIRDMRKAVKERGFEVKEVLEILKLPTLNDVRADQVEAFYEFLDEPGTLPDTFATSQSLSAREAEESEGRFADVDSVRGKG